MPRSIHKALARSIWAAATLGIAVGLTLFGTLVSDGGISLREHPISLWTIFAGVAFTTMGLVIGITFIWQFIGRVVLKLQGWPFHTGEIVEVLTGAHEGTIAEIYEVWESRAEVRLSIGKEEREQVNDVFSAINVVRANLEGEQGVAPNP